MPRPRKLPNPFRYFRSSPEVIRLVVMMYVRFPLSLRNVEDLLFDFKLQGTSWRRSCSGLHRAPLSPEGDGSPENLIVLSDQMHRLELGV